MNSPREWFGPKTVGIGWVPRTWEGWAVLAAIVVAGAAIGRVGN